MSLSAVIHLEAYIYLIFRVSTESRFPKFLPSFSDFQAAAARQAAANSRQTDRLEQFRSGARRALTLTADVDSVLYVTRRDRGQQEALQYPIAIALEAHLAD